MTPARIAALEACAEALEKLVVYRATLAKPIDQDFREAIERAKEKAWTAAIAAIERLDGLRDD